MAEILMWRTLLLVRLQHDASKIRRVLMFTKGCNMLPFDNDIVWKVNGEAKANIVLVWSFDVDNFYFMSYIWLCLPMGCNRAKKGHLSYSFWGLFITNITYNRSPTWNEINCTTWKSWDSSSTKGNLHVYGVYTLIH